VIEMPHDIVETQAIDPLATNLTLLEVNAFLGLYWLRGHTCWHRLTFEVDLVTATHRT
jgi:hypothetical protein